MNVLFISHIFPSPAQPAVGPYNYQIFAGIARRCSAMAIVPRAWWTQIKTPAKLMKPEVANFDGQRVVYPPYWSIPKLTSAHADAMYYSLIQSVKQMHRSKPFDAILAAWAYPDAVAAARIGKTIGCPVIWNVLGSDINELPASGPILAHVKQGLADTSYVIAVSEALRTRVVAAGLPNHKAITIHNGVDGEKFQIRNRQQARQRCGLQDAEHVIVCVGRLSHEKGQDVLLQALPALDSLAKRQVKLVFVGGGNTEATLRKMASDLGIESRVVFTGMIRPDEIPQWIDASDVLCLPSRREGCPNAVLEALASGRPVVASHIGGVPELINGNNGVLVPADNPASLANGLYSALERPWDAQELRNTVEHLSWDEVAGRYYEVLQKAVAEQRQ